MFRVLVAADGQEVRTRNQAAAVASLPCASEEVAATVLYVFPELRSDEGSDVRMKEYSSAPESVESAVSYLEAQGIDVEPTTRSGDPATEIQRVAREIDADQIVVGGRKRSPIGKAVFGSVSQEVILNAERPVLSVGEDMFD